jgi:L-ribulose-5-phosphate 4-epimerase
MSQNYLMGLDAGGGGGRCLLVDTGSGHIVTTYRPWSHPVAPETGGWGFDLDVAGCWAALGEVAREAMARAGASPEQILAVAATSMRHAVVLLDRDGQEIFAVPNRDARAATEGMALADEHGATLHERTGHWPSPICPAARLRWLAANAPDIWERAWCFLNISDWVAYRLSGEAATDPSQAAETSLFDLATRDWAWNLIDMLGLPREIFPSIREMGTPLGQLTAEAAEALGLRPGIPVAVGGADTQCGLLGAGAVAAGQMGAIAGTTTPMQYVIDRPLIDPEGHVWTGCHVAPGLWVMESNAGGMGEALAWLAGMLYPDAAHPVAMLVAEAAESEPGAAGMLSTIGADIFDARNFGLPMGTLTLTHLAAAQDPTRRRHLARAVLEGMACSLRANAAQIVATAGAEQPPLALAGGMSQSAVWAAMVADVLDVPVYVPPTPQASGLGAAIGAGVAAGVFGDLAAGVGALVKPVSEFAPDPSRAQTYQMLYDGWNRVREARSEADELAAGMALDAILGAQEAGAVTAGAAFRPRVLVTADMDDRSLSALRAVADVDYASYREAMRLLTGDELVDELQGYHVFITEVDVVDADALTKLPDLRAIGVCRGAVVNVDLAACTALGIPVLNTPGRNADAVADLTVAFILMLARRLPEAAAFLQQPGGEAGDMARMGQVFNALQGQELWRKTIGLVGLGAVGRAVAERLRPFRARLLVYDPYVSPEQIYLAGAEPASLDAVIEESDFISLHAAVTDETRGLIGAEAFSRMKPGAFLINTARAALVDEEALTEALQSGHLGGAALDVFAVEPPGSDHPLLAMPNVVATPHVGGNTTDVSAHQGQMIVDDLTRMIHGERPRYVLNPETWEKFSWEAPREALSPEQLAELAAGPGPAVSDLQVEAAAGGSDAEREVAHEEPKKGGIRRLFGGREREEEAAASPAGDAAAATPSGRHQMERLLAAFLDHVRNDAKLQEFSGGKHVVMHFTLPDVGQQFYIAFQDGTLLADMGEPPEPAHARLKMSAEIFDGMFTGKTNPTRAAMTGKISFSGDTAKAMTLQRIQKDLTRLYSQASEEVGGPGDLSAAAAPAAPAALPITPAPAPAAAPVSGAAAGIRDHMARILETFVDAVTKDAALTKFSSGKNVVMHFTLSDLDLQFYFAFQDGTVVGAVGAPPEQAHARLKMQADVLDGMFTGRTNPTRTAMSGKLSFSGDTAKAMTLQRIQKDLSRLYSQAREQIGDPGDLTVIPAEPSPAAPAPMEHAPAAAVPYAPAAIVAKVGDERDDLVQAVNELYAIQLITATGGNLSVRVPDTDQIWITPSQLYKGDLRPDLMVRLDVNGQVMDPDAPSPSSEWPMHCAIYRARPDVEAIIHTHAPQATLLVLSGLPFLPISTEAAFLGDIPRVPFIMPGTTELAEAVAAALGAEDSAVFMQNHGMLVASSSLRRAANVSEVIERTSEMILGCYAVGKEPPVLPDDVVAQLRELGKMMA